MASGSFSGSVCDGHYKLLIEWTGTSSTANNNSVVKVTAKLVNDWGLDIGSRTGTITIDGTSYSISSSAISTKGTHTLGTASKTVAHASNGAKTISISVKWNMQATISGYGYISSITASSSSVVLDNIPRYATSTQSLNSKTGTSIKMNWSSNSTIDYIWYSTNGGTSWTAVGSVNATSGTYTISGLSAGTTYSIKTRVRRKDSQLTTDSSALSVTTYAYPTCTISNTSKTETSITIKWTSNKTINKYWFSTNNGSTWTEKSASSTNATFTISGLSANTAYNIKVKVQASESSLQTTSSTLAVTTYQFPYVSKLGSADLTIGNSQTLTLYNPLGRSITVYMRQNNVSGEIFKYGTTSGTSITLTPSASDLYASIPNSKSGTAYYYAEYSGNRPNPKTGTYTVPASSAPTVSTLTYEDINTAVQNVIQNNQLIVQNKSQVRFTCTGLTAKNSASIASAKVVVNNQTVNLTISGSSASGGSAVISVASATTATLTVTDSRGLTVTKTVEINMLAWANPTGLITMQRQDNYYSLTYITVDAIYSSLDGKNAVTIEYRARATGQTDITGSLQDNVQGSFTADNTLDWTVIITITDALNGTITYQRTLPRGTPIIFFDSKKYSVGINCFPDGDHRFEILSTDGNSQHDVAEELEQHEDDINKSVKVTTAGTAVGSGTKPIYINASGQAIASGSTVGASAKPIFLSSGVLTASNSSLGGTAKPIYMASGELKALSGSLGGTTQPIYMTSGEFKACTDIYRSGTWTPSFANNSITLTAGTVRGWYMKIGKMVLVGMSLKAGTLKNGSKSNQSIKITGLPFTPDTVVLHYSGGGHVQGTGLRWNGTSTTNFYHYLTGFVIDSTATAGIFLRTLANNTEKANGTSYVQIPASATVSSVYMSCTITYMATS